MILPSPCPQYRADSRFAPNQWETVLLCNDASYFWAGRKPRISPEDTHFETNNLLRKLYHTLICLFQESFVLCYYSQRTHQYCSIVCGNYAMVFIIVGQPIYCVRITMIAIASQITSLTIVYSTVYSDADQRKHQSSASLAFVRGIHRGPANSPHKWPVSRKMFLFDDVIMEEVETLYTIFAWVVGKSWDVMAWKHFRH